MEVFYQMMTTRLLDNDLEFTREHFHKPIKFGVVSLDEKVFSIYTKSLLHSTNVLHKYKFNNMLQSDKNKTMGDSNDEINIKDIQSMLTTTSLTPEYVHSFLEEMHTNLFKTRNIQMKLRAVGQSRIGSLESMISESDMNMIERE